MLSVFFGFGASHGPIRRRERDAPKSRGRVYKIHPHFSLLCLMRAEINHSTRHFLSGSGMPKGKQLSAGYLQAQHDARTVCIHGDFQYHTLTAALSVVITTTRGRNSAHIAKLPLFSNLSSYQLSR